MKVETNWIFNPEKFAIIGLRDGGKSPGPIYPIDNGTLFPQKLLEVWWGHPPLKILYSNQQPDSNTILSPEDKGGVISSIHLADLVKS